ncbi:hypothetical protein ACTI_18700 [Actinoplanes sp. OR16]|uniref:hypothetical protein n=2 Tax=unclassified Actinoplanes TaxID=2626549 RepID=UPI000F6E73FC|nr:hypothetical protein [Actinoplanes sp. OR16]BBH65185.1 hypothetical protein ACTI_18700 [Actinoplanes sp. OR16]
MTNVGTAVTLGFMAPSPERLDPERCRRRQELLAALAQAKTVRESDPSQRMRGVRLRELIATRRRPAN